jgi:TolB protein
MSTISFMCVLNCLSCCLGAGEPGVGEATQLTFPDTFHKAGESYVSPDGSKIIFQAVPTPLQGESPSEHYDMYIADLEVASGEGEPPFHLDNIRRLNAPGSANTCGWFHPSDPGLVLYATTIGPPQAQHTPGYQRASGKYRWAFPPGMRIVKQRIDSEDATPERLVGDDQSYQAEGSWSPDGRHVIYTDLATGEGDIYAHDLVTGATSKVVGAPGYDGGPFFSPDGKRITWRGDRRGNDLLQLFVGELAFDDTGSITGLDRVFQLTDDEHVNWAPFWHPDGKRLVFATSREGHRNYEVFEIEADSGGDHGPTRYGTTARRVTEATGFDGLPAFNPDGTLMIWTAQRGESASSQLFIAPFVKHTAPAPVVNVGGSPHGH